jgi:hypothetical protein
MIDTPGRRRRFWKIYAPKRLRIQDFAELLTRGGRRGNKTIKPEEKDRNGRRRK